RRREHAPVRAALDRIEQRGGARRQRAVGEQLEPAERQPARFGLAQRRAAAQAAGDGVVEAVGANGGVDADGELACLRERDVHVERAAGRVGRERARVVGTRYAERQQLSTERTQRPFGGLVVRRRHAIDDKAAGILQERARRRATGV